MKPTYCYWALGVGEKYEHVLRTSVNSLRRWDRDTPFHVFSESSIEGAVQHLPRPELVKKLERKLGIKRTWNYLLKLECLKEMHQIPYDFYIFLDADTFFARKPPDLSKLIGDDPMHVFLEGRLASPEEYKKAEWHKCPTEVMVKMMNECGAKKEHIYHLNGGFWMVRRDFIHELCEAAYTFWKFCANRGYYFDAEPLFSYLMATKCNQIENHLLSNNTNIFYYDLLGAFRKQFPKNQPWGAVKFGTDELFMVNPAIIHCLKSKKRMRKEGEKLAAEAAAVI